MDQSTEAILLNAQADVEEFVEVFCASYKDWRDALLAPESNISFHSNQIKTCDEYIQILKNDHSLNEKLALVRYFLKHSHRLSQVDTQPNQLQAMNQLPPKLPTIAQIFGTSDLKKPDISNVPNSADEEMINTEEQDDRR